MIKLELITYLQILSIIFISYKKKFIKKRKKTC